MRRHTKQLIRMLRKELGSEIECGVEIGVWRGHNSMHLLSQFPGMTLVMCDPYDLGGNHATQTGSIREFRAAAKEARELTDQFHERRCILQKDSVPSSKEFRDEMFDFGFLDACHLYEDVRQDLAAWYGKIKEGGVFCGHDYNSKMDRKGEWGVKKAVDEFCKLHDYAPAIQPGNVWWIKKGQHSDFVDPIAEKEVA